MSLIKRSPESLKALLCGNQHTDYLDLPTLGVTDDTL